MHVARTCSGDKQACKKRDGIVGAKMCVKSRKADIASQPLIRNTSFVKVIVRNHDNNLTVFEACD